jgi:hypothetical protein
MHQVLHDEDQTLFSMEFISSRNTLDVLVKHFESAGQMLDEIELCGEIWLNL